MIIPISAFSNNSMKSLQLFLKEYPSLHISTYHQRPASLFDGVLQRLSIFLADSSAQKKQQYTTNVNRWYSACREHLFPNIQYVSNEVEQNNTLKLYAEVENSIYTKLQRFAPLERLLSPRPTDNCIYYRTAGGGYWVYVLNEAFESEALSNKRACFEPAVSAKAISAALNSNLYWWYYYINYDCFNFKDYMLFSFPFGELKEPKRLVDLSDSLFASLKANARAYTIRSKTRGDMVTYTYSKPSSKDLMDEIDVALAKHYGLSGEELDHVINYDIKYRMGDELEGDGADDGDSAEPKAIKAKPPKAAAAKKAAKPALRAPQGEKPNKQDPDPFV
jgi:hypothetical protein